MIIQNNLLNNVLPIKIYVVLDRDWRKVAEVAADTAHQALREGKALPVLGDRCRTAILKSQYEPSLARS